MEIRHLLAVNLTEDKSNVYYDDTPFTAARLSPATRKASEESANQLHKIIMKGMKLPLLFAGYILVGIGFIVLMSFIKALFDVDFMTALERAKWILIGGGVSAAIGGGLLLYHKTTTEKAEEKEDSEDLPPEEAASYRALESTAEQVRLELGVPADDDLTTLELLPYHYKKSSNGTPKESLQNGCFANTDLFLWKEDGALCLTDYDCVLKIPTDAIEGYYTVPDKYKISMWWKDEDHDKEPYAAYRIKEDGEGNYRLSTYYRVIIRHGEDRYEMRVPCYDFPALRELVDMACLDAAVSP